MQAFLNNFFPVKLLLSDRLFYVQIQLLYLNKICKKFYIGTLIRPKIKLNFFEQKIKASALLIVLTYTRQV